MSVFFLFLFAISLTEAAGIPPLLKRVESKYAGARTVIAQFTQVVSVASLKKERKSSGTIAVKRPGRMRWQIQEPDPNLLVSNGTWIWHYTPPFDENDRGQYTQRKASDVQAPLANALLSGAFSVAKDMKYRKLGNRHFELIPQKNSGGDILKAEIFIHSKKETIERIKLYHRGGNKSDIRLSQVTLGKPLSDSHFNFVPPKNTDKVVQ